MLLVLYGALEIEIKEFEQRHRMTFPLAFRVALLHFGRKMNIGVPMSMTMQFILPELERVMSLVASLKLKSVIQRLAKVTVYLG
ncbi:MAG: hypothetical protein RLZZ628_1504 [Bacteroidota bacterium]|jgi:hypothetical protein